MVTKTAMVARVLARGRVCHGANGLILRLGHTYLAYDCRHWRVWFYYRGIRKELKGRIVDKLNTMHSFGRKS